MCISFLFYKKVINILLNWSLFSLRIEKVIFFINFKKTYEQEQLKRFGEYIEIKVLNMNKKIDNFKCHGLKIEKIQLRYMLYYLNMSEKLKKN